jgi:hypothetical protein
MVESDEAMCHLREERHREVWVTTQWEGLKAEEGVEPGFDGCETDPEAFDAL